MLGSLRVWGSMTIGEAKLAPDILDYRRPYQNQNSIGSFTYSKKKKKKFMSSSLQLQYCRLEVNQSNIPIVLSSNPIILHPMQLRSLFLSFIYGLFELKEKEEEYSRIDPKLVYFQPTLLYSSPLPLHSHSIQMDH